MSVELFRDNDPGYAAWLAANARGYVLNIQRAFNPSDARLHHANCRTISDTPGQPSSDAAAPAAGYPCLSRLGRCS